MRSAVWLVGFLVACTPNRSPTPASTRATASANASAIAIASTSVATLPAPPAIAAGPIRVVGYPLTVSTGMNDPATTVGFTRDGAEYGWCGSFGGRDPQDTRCDFVRRDGTHHTLDSDDDKHDYSKKRDKEIHDWIREQGVPSIDFSAQDFTKHFARPLKGSWAFSDVTIWVNPVSSDGLKSDAVVQLGGAVDGEGAVYPVALHAPTATGTPRFHTAIMNDLSLSPDGAEIGAVGHFFCGEWCNDFAIYRATAAAFASLVYNDTGFRHHKKGEYARAAELFTKAAAADPHAKLPPYNLACAWARVGDARAKDALTVAIASDATVKARAPADADFAAVKNDPWFVALVAP